MDALQIAVFAFHNEYSNRLFLKLSDEFFSTLLLAGSPLHDSHTSIQQNS